MEWNKLSEVDQLEEIDKRSQEKPVVLFKHSTRCSISSMALSRFERSFKEDAEFEPYYLDLITNRDVSNLIAERYNVTHQSPQAILIKNGKAIFDSSHTAIDFMELNEKAKN